MARSRDWRNYLIVTKRPKYSFHSYSNGLDVSRHFKEDRDKTFWIYDVRNGELLGRYSVESAPHWIMEIYSILVDNE